MRRYAFRAVSASGELLSGLADAANRIDLEARLRQSGHELVSARERPSLPRFLGKRVDARAMIHFCFHLEQMLGAGISVVDALSDLRGSSGNPKLDDTITDILGSIHGGATLADAFAAHPDVFDPVFLAQIRTGETTGELDRALRQIGHALEREEDLRSFLGRITIYPAFVLGITLSALLVALVFVMPEVARLFKSSGVSLPMQTRVLMACAGFMQNYGLHLLTMLAACVAVTAGLLGCTSAGRELRDKLRLGFPVLGAIYRKILLARLAGTVSDLYSAGVHALEIFRICRDSTGNILFDAALARIEADVSAGQGLSDAFTRSGLFPPIVLRMIRTGEQTGALDVALRNTCRYYEKDIHAATGRMQAAMEPLLLLFLGGLMLWVATAILGPIYDIVTKMRY